MKAINSIRVRNLRSFGKTSKYIPIKKINVLVGRNSCGKSTLLRTFPLIRQSIEAKTKSPILWYGNYVDFGDFQTARNSGSDQVSFDFNMIIELPRATQDHFQYPWMRWEEDIPNINFPCELSVGIGEIKSGGAESLITFSVSHVTVIFKYSELSLATLEASSNDLDIYEAFSDGYVASRGQFVPTDFRRVVRNRNIKKEVEFATLSSEADHKFAKFIYQYHHKSKDFKNVLDTISKLPICLESEVSSELALAFASDKFFQKQLSLHSEHISKASFLYLVCKFFVNFLTKANEAITQFYGGVRYLGPLRASAERYYRYQDLQVEEIDHTGSNLPMVINSLNRRQKANLSEWISDSFGFDLELKNTGHHYALSIKETGHENFHNISDMGFGYSQILPVIVSIWLESQDKSTTRTVSIRRSKNSVIVIEQPELHLHPELQYRFGLAICKIAELQSDDDFCFVIETHSKHIIDAIGESIATGAINDKDVNINLFEKNSAGITNTSFSKFDADGYLVDWPAGFLSV